MITLQQLTSYLNHSRNLTNIDSLLSNKDSTDSLLRTHARTLFVTFVEFNNQNSREKIDALVLCNEVNRLIFELELDVLENSHLINQVFLRLIEDEDKILYPIMPEDIRASLEDAINIEIEEAILSAFGEDDEDVDVTAFNPRFSPKNGCRFYGLEVEFNSATVYEEYSVEDTLGTLNEIKSSLQGKGKVIKDGSCGYEMVSAPYEFDDMIEYIDRLPLDRVKVDDRCGIHIHVSRDIFTPLMLGRLLVFINSFENLRYIEKKVGRGCNRYCAISYKGEDPTKVKLDSTTRYEAINLTNLSEDKFTIEFRMFASTTDKQAIKDYLTWLDKIITLSQKSDLTIDLIESAL